MYSAFPSKKFGILLTLLCFAFFAFTQSTTTASLQGRVVDNIGDALVGANVLVTHLPSGTANGTSTDADGYFYLTHLRVGGPYTVVVTYLGYADATTDGVFLRLGETRQSNCTMQPSRMDLGTVTVNGRRGTTGANAGAGTQIGTDDIANVPTLNRNLNDYIRLTPQALTYNGGNAFGGVNNRYNTLYIDGAVNNDVFGLTAQGTNGAQAGTAPFSMDIIDQLQVVLSPYDVSLGGFAGGGINAVTKSGTNDMVATAYYFTQNQNLVGTTHPLLTERTGNPSETLEPFTQRMYGASVGGALKKNKAFFFVNAELQRDAVPQPFSIGTYTGNATPAALDDLRSTLISRYGYDPGTYGDVSDELRGIKLFGKIDLNLNTKSRLTLRHHYTKAENFNPNVSNALRINFTNNGAYFPSITNVSALEWNTRPRQRTSNNLILSYTSVREDRDPLGADFPSVVINDGAGQIAFGADPFASATELNQSVFTLTDNYKIFANKHTITLGTHNEFYRVYNLFIGQNFGAYRFGSIADFTDGRPALEYDRGYSLVDDIAGDGSAAGARFSVLQWAVYAQDEIALSPKLRLTAGLRLDVPVWLDKPFIAPDFDDATLPLLQAQYDVARRTRAGNTPGPQLLLSPRVGFIHQFNPQLTRTLRGGVGIFTSRMPMVWPATVYTNNGITLGRVDESNLPAPVAFEPDVDAQYVHPNFTIPSGQIDLFTEDFKYPQVLKANLAYDWRLKWGWFASVEGVFTKTLNNIVYTNINSDTTVQFRWTNLGDDDRPVYRRNSLDPAYSSIYLAHNTSQGSAYHLTGTLSKSFGFGLDASVSYTYGDAKALNEGTSSQNASQWRGQVNTDGRNQPVLGRSDFALGHRVLGVFTYKLNWNKSKNTATTVTLLYEGLRSSPYSYVIGGNLARNLNRETGSTDANTSLAWIPATAADIQLIDKDGLTAAQQWALLDAFIESDPYLRDNRGQYAAKNSNWMPFAHLFDISLRQDVGFKKGWKKHNIQLTCDIFNVANLINPNWGVRYQVPGSTNYFPLYQFERYAADGTTPQFSFTNPNTGVETLDIQDLASRWSMRVGVRYGLD